LLRESAAIQEAGPAIEGERGRPARAWAGGPYMRRALP
jgi:hypothetical protein